MFKPVHFLNFSRFQNFQLEGTLHAKPIDASLYLPHMEELESLCSRPGTGFVVRFI